MGNTFWGVYALARKAALGNPHAVCVGGRRRPRKFCGFVSSIRLQSQDGLQMVAALSNGWPPPADRSAPPPPAAAGGVCHAVAGAVAATAPTSPALGAEKIAGAAAANLAAEPPLAGRQHVGALAPPLAAGCAGRGAGHASRPNGLRWRTRRTKSGPWISKAGSAPADGTRVEPLTVRDLYSRRVLDIRLLPDQSDAQARRAMTRLFQRFGLPQVIRVDNGAPFGGSGPLGELLQPKATA